MKSSDPLLTGAQDGRSFMLFEPKLEQGQMQCHVVIMEDGRIVWEQAIFGEDRNNAIHCALISLNGFFDDLQLPPTVVASAMDTSP